MQGVIKAYDPASGDGVIMCDSDLADYELAPGALDGSIFRMLRQGQRVPPGTREAPRRLEYLKVPWRWATAAVRRSGARAHVRAGENCLVYVH